MEKHITVRSEGKERILPIEQQSPVVEGDGDIELAVFCPREESTTDLVEHWLDESWREIGVADLDLTDEHRERADEEPYLPHAQEAFCGQEQIRWLQEVLLRREDEDRIIGQDAVASLQASRLYGDVGRASTSRHIETLVATIRLRRAELRACKINPETHGVVPSRRI